MPARSAVPVAPVNSITLSLISHTNVGKTTLARTLLRRDVGTVDDAPHVTTVNEAYLALEAEGAELRLWDTPGFGDSHRLLKRLKREKNPVLWFLSQTWDRIVDRPLWCSQQAMQNVRDDADIILYLINASEPPEAAGYVKPEMEILSWVKKPVLVLLNQTGPLQPDAIEIAEIEDWTRYMRGFDCVADVLPMDAFARCWIHEHHLLDAIASALPTEKRSTFTPLLRAWKARNDDIFDQSSRILGALLATSARDGVEVRSETFFEKLHVGRAEIDQAYADARKQLAERLAERIEATTNELIHLHGLEGQAARKIGHTSNSHFDAPEKISENVWSLASSFAGGAMLGLIADLKAGGLTFGGGALIGGVASGLGAYALIFTYNLVRGEDRKLHWSQEHFREQVRLALLCYLAIAHFGRGRGEWSDGEQPEHWRLVVDGIIEAHRAEMDRLWKKASAASQEEALTKMFQALIQKSLRDVLKRLYPTTA